MRKNVKNGVIAALIVVFAFSLLLFASCEGAVSITSDKTANQSVLPDGSQSAGAGEHAAPSSGEGETTSQADPASADTSVEQAVTATIYFYTGYEDVTVKPVTGEAGAPVTAPDEPAAPTGVRKLFVCWQLNGEDYAFTVIPESDITLTAKWVAYNLVRFDTGDDNFKVANERVPEGESATKPDVEREGYILRYWKLNDNPFDFSTVITENTVLTAEWLARTNLSTLVIELRDSQGDEYNIDNVDRDNYVTGKITLMNAAGDYEVNECASSFKGRGNGSWSNTPGSKNDYKIKFDKKQSLFGREANKHWVILACTNFNDVTMLRNYTTYNMAGEIFDGLEFVTCAEWVDVFINGEYRGVYVLCEHTRVGKGRVNIKSEYGVEDTGYLIEYDAYAEGTEGIDYFDINTSSNKMVKYKFTVHSPDPEEYVSDGKITEAQYRAQVSYIKEYVYRVYKAAIVDKDFETLSSLVDMDSLVDMYILHEFYKNTDAGYSSFYLYKKPGGKLYFGPPWDFDATTTAARGEENDPNGIYVADTVKNKSGNTNSELYAALYKQTAFLNLVKARWAELSPKMKIYYDNLFAEEFYTENRYALGKNFVRWSNNNGGFPGGGFPGGGFPGGGFPGGGFPGQGGQGDQGGQSSGTTQAQAEETWINNCKTLKKWFDDRLAWLDNEWKIST